MSDYKQTRDAAGIITSRFSNMLMDLQDDYEQEIVIVALMKYYEICGDGDEDLLWAIERVLHDFMPSKDFNDWMLTRYGGNRGG